MGNNTKFAGHMLATGGTLSRTTIKRRTPRPTIYFVRAQNGLIKIGETKYLDDRMASLRTGSPIELTLLATTKGCRKVEHEYHARFSEHRLHGEWFTPHPDLLSEIDRLQMKKRPRRQA